jgi:threonine aldolase
MRAAMAAAELGDDVWGEDPTVTRLEEEVGSRLGKEAAVFVPSGTMGNLASVAAQTRPGDEVIADSQAHVVIYEVGGTAVVAGVQLRLLDGFEGVPDAATVRDAVRGDNIHYPVSRLLCLENTHNRRGGAAISANRIREAATAAHDCGLRVHCDGARLFNAAIALETDARSLAGYADSVSFCLSKGLACPVGSLLCGSRDFITQAHRVRKLLGGGMRQAGIIAAAGIVALEKMVERLAEDHLNARALAEGLGLVAGINVQAVSRRTNMVFFEVDGDESTAGKFLAALHERDVLIGQRGSNSFRAVTHYGVDRPAIDRVVSAAAEAAGEAFAG